MLDYDILKRLIKPDNDLGSLMWLPRDKNLFKRECDYKNWNERYAYTEALTNVNNGGYFQGEIFGVPHKAHRVMWYLNSGVLPDIVDHINGNRQDNRILNLRDVDLSDNAKNRKLTSRNTSGIYGVSFCSKSNRWIAKIQSKGKVVILGRYIDKESAISARRNGEIEYGFHENHGRTRISQNI